MSEPLRSEDTRPTDPVADREARIEQLLLSGLDHYFAAEYEQAIHVWTRVVFLDRNHDRARAYIERARQALAERQRESEELVQRGIEAFNNGQTGTSRQLLNEAITRGGSNEVALAFLDRLNRVEAGSVGGATLALEQPPGRLLLPQPAEQPPASGSRRSRAWIGVAAALCAVLVGALFLWWQGTQADGRSDAAASVAVGAPAEPLPVPRSSEMILLRARTLYESGRLLDVLAVLDAVPPADALRGDADQLRAEVQRELLAGSVPAQSPVPPPSPASIQPSSR